jgi:hypothetical protein
MFNKLLPGISLLAVATVAFSAPGPGADVDEAVLRKAATFYASFDEEAQGDFGGGDLYLSTRMDVEGEKGRFEYEKGFDAEVFRIAKDKGVHGGALECTNVLKRNGRIYFPAKGNLAYQKGGWGGSVSVWFNTDPNTRFKTPFCDPIQITQKGANNGGIWFDFNNDKPRGLRMGVFPAVAEGQTPVKESDPKAPMVRVKDPGFKAGDWHHVVLTWTNFDTGKSDGRAALYIDGKLIGEVKDADLHMDWDLDRTGIYVGVNFIGLLDELALFNRALTAEEVALLRAKPGLLAGLKKK